MDQRRARLTLDIDPALHSRLRIVTARRGTTMRRYLEEALERRLEEEPPEHLIAEEAPLLADLWDNPDDAAYDEL